MAGAWLDRSVVFDFDRTGFERHRAQFAPETSRSLEGADVLITGGTAGIGLAAAQALSRCGAHVHLWARNPERGAAAAAAVDGRFSSVDLGDLSAVAQAAHQAPLRSVGAVLLNAGAMPLERTLTPQGHELTWASQVLGHFLLLRVLRRRGLLGPHSRVVWVSSGGLYTQRLDLRDLTCAQRYQRHRVYANAKRAQVELVDWLSTHRPGVPMAVMHPGWVDTAAVAHSMPLFHRLTRPILRTPEQGADTLVWLVRSEPAWPGGRLWFDRREASAHRSARTRSRPGDRQRLIDHVLEATQPFLEQRV